MNLKQYYLTNNNCYKAGRTITPKGVMVHSTGANNPSLKRYVGPNDGALGENTNNNHWNTAKPGGDEICCHAFIGQLANGNIATYQTLPWNYRGWHGGGNCNNTHIGFEICEDGLSDTGYFNKVYQEAVELTAYLCKTYGLNPQADGVVICHSEGYKRGIATNHADVMHWFPKHGKSMDTFRADVAAAMGNTVVNGGNSSSGSTGTQTSSGGDSIIRGIQTQLNAKYTAGLTVDGYYGPKTKSGQIKGIQRELNRQFNAGLVEDGIWGPKTKAACVTVRKGAQGNITYLLQSMLYCHGYNPGDIDGIFGAKTDAALRSFQKAKGLTVDGVAGQNTFEKLLG